jgi:serine/threonine protein kinase
MRSKIFRRYFLLTFISVLYIFVWRLSCSVFVVDPRKFQYCHNVVAHISPNTMVLTFIRPSCGSSWNIWPVALLLILYVNSLLCSSELLEFGSITLCVIMHAWWRSCPALIFSLMQLIILKLIYLLQLQSNNPLDETSIACITRDLLHAVEYLHNEGKIHRDIKGLCALIEVLFFIC